jgi:hypothetical protein
MISKLSACCFVAVLLLGSQDARAQFEWGDAYAEAQCDGQQVEVTVTLNIYGEVPPELVGWVVDREVIGECAAPVQVGSALPLPSGEQQFVVIDSPSIMDRMTTYHIHAVDAAGDRTPIYWRQRTMYAQAACVGGPVVRGTVVEAFGSYTVEPCEGHCWPGLSTFDNSFPPEISTMVGEVVDVFGEVYLGLEGQFVVATDIQLAANGCDQVIAVDPISWGTLKGAYR